MAKDKLTDYDSTASGNLDVGGISVAEGMLPSGVNNAIREQMSHLADFAAGTSGVDVLKLQDDTDTNSIKLQAPVSVTTTTTFTLPDGDGASGQTMITDGAGTLAWAAPYGNRNLIINGAMQVAQRGTVATGGSTGLHYGGPDRWRMYQENTAAAYTLSQDTNVPSGQGFAYSYKIDVTTADATVDAADRADFIYRFEGQDLQQIAKGTSGAKAMTLSFWVSSPKTGTHIIEVFDSDNNRQVSIAYTVSTANTWEHKTVAIPADTTGTLNNDNDLSLQISWWLMAGSNYSGGTLNTSWASYTNANRAVGQVNLMDSISNNFYLTGVQLEVGSTATPFEHRSYADELARCQRYYERVSGASTEQRTFATGKGTSSTNLRTIFYMKTVKRASPTISGTTVRCDVGADATSPSLWLTGLHNVGIDYTTSGLSTNNMYLIYNRGGSADYIDMDAEL